MSNKVFMVSIIVPVYNAASHLRRCIESAVNQIYKNLEIILVDDGSSDNSPQICDEYMTKDNRIVVLHKCNGGASDARNVGTQAAHGEYIFYLDSDDELPRDAISSLMQSVNENLGVEMVVGKTKGIPHPSWYANSRFDSETFVDDNIWIKKNFYRIYYRIPVQPWNKVILKSFIIQNKLFFKKGIVHEDELWMFDVTQKMSKLGFVNKTTYLHYVRPGSVMTSMSKLEKRRSWGVILKEIYKKIDKPVFGEPFIKYYGKIQENQSLKKDEYYELYKDVWKEFIRCAKRNGHPFIALFLRVHGMCYPVLKGRGIGYALSKFLPKEFKNIIEPAKKTSTEASQ